MYRTLSQISMIDLPQSVCPRRSLQVVRKSSSQPREGDQEPGRTGEILWWQDLHVKQQGAEMGLVLFPTREFYNRHGKLSTMLETAQVGAMSWSDAPICWPLFYPERFIEAIYHEQWHRWDEVQCDSHILVLCDWLLPEIESVVIPQLDSL